MNFKRQSYLDNHISKNIALFGELQPFGILRITLRFVFCFFGGFFFGVGVGGDVSLFIVGNSEITEQSSSAINKISIYKIYRGNITSIY